MAQSTATVIQPLEVLELVLSTKRRAPATPAESAYRATSKLAELVPEPRYQPICVILTELAGLVSLTTTEEPSIVVSAPAGSAVGATETKPTLVCRTRATKYPQFLPPPGTFWPEGDLRLAPGHGGGNFHTLRATPTRCQPSYSVVSNLCWMVARLGVPRVNLISGRFHVSRLVG